MDALWMAACDTHEWKMINLEAQVFVHPSLRSFIYPFIHSIGRSFFHKSTSSHTPPRQPGNYACILSLLHLLGCPFTSILAFLPSHIHQVVFSHPQTCPIPTGIRELETPSVHTLHYQPLGQKVASPLRKTTKPKRRVNLIFLTSEPYVCL